MLYLNINLKYFRTAEFPLPEPGEFPATDFGGFGLGILDPQIIGDGFGHNLAEGQIVADGMDTRFAVNIRVDIADRVTGVEHGLLLFLGPACI